MKRDKITYLFLTSIIFLFLMSVASAAVGTTALSQPASSSVVAGTIKLNATITNVAGNFTCIFYAKSASTANSTWTTLATVVNNTNISANTTYNSKALEDSNDYTFNATCSNSTNLWSAGVNTDIVIDNTIPQAPSSLTPASATTISSATTQTFSSTVTDVNTTSCTYRIGRGGTETDSADTTTGTATYSAATCSFTKTFSSNNDNGEWYWYITASDGSNTTDSSKNVANVRIPPAGGTPYSVVKQIQSTGTVKKSFYMADNTQTTISWVVGIIAVLIIVFFIFKRR